LGILFGFSFALMPNWMFLFFRNLNLSFKETLIGSPGDALGNHWGAAGERFAIAIAVILGILMFFEWWQSRRSTIKHFVWTAMLTLVISQWIGIKTNTSNFVILYPAFIIGLHFLWERWNQRALGTIFSILAGLFGVTWLLLLISGNPGLIPPISSLLMIPLPLVTLVLLYWSRWWVSRSQKIQIEPTQVTLQKP
jgi:membrane-anchored protein YejM (alkaline phosphatase superfamily)